MKRILIIGQGISGTVLGCYLEDAGIDFSIADIYEENHSSSVAAGAVNPLVFKRLIPGWRSEEASEYAINFYRSREVAPGDLWKDKPVLKIFNDEAELVQWKKNQSGFCGEVIQNPEGVAGNFGAGKVNFSGYVDVKRFIREFRERLILKGKFIHEKIPSKDLQVFDDHVIFNDERYTDVVFCEGNGISENIFFNYIRLVPAKGEILEIELEDLRPDFIYSRNLFLLPLEAKNRWLAGSTFRWNDLTLDPTEDCKMELKSRVDKILTLPYKIVNQITGVRPSSHDRRPIVGNHPRFKPLWILNGFGAKGVLLSPIMVLELVKAISGIDQIHTETRVGRFFFDSAL